MNTKNMNLNSPDNFATASLINFVSLNKLP
jgi:hypothetical protein